MQQHEYLILTLLNIFEGYGQKGGRGASLVHEQLMKSFLYVPNGAARDSALKAGWFFLELTIKAMVEHLATTAR